MIICLIGKGKSKWDQAEPPPTSATATAPGEPTITAPPPVVVAAPTPNSPPKAASEGLSAYAQFV